MEKNQAAPNLRLVAAGIQVQRAIQRAQSRNVGIVPLWRPKQLALCAMRVGIICIHLQRGMNGVFRPRKPLRSSFVHDSNLDARFGQPRPGIRETRIQGGGLRQQFHRAVQVPPIHPRQPVLGAEIQFKCRRAVGRRLGLASAFRFRRKRL